MKKITFTILAVLLLSAIACEITPDISVDISDNSISVQNVEDAVATSVAATVQAGEPRPDNPPAQPADPDAPAQPEGQPAPTDPPERAQPSIIEGQVCYPSEYIPAMTVYLENVVNQTAVEVAIPLNGGNFSQQVPPGEYIAYSWLPDFSGGGSYSQAVPCGLSVNCQDHSLIQFIVPQGATVTDIDICDWYGGPGSIPLPPGVNINSITGSISGTLGYPSESIPAMQVVAFNTNTTFWYYVGTAENANSYTITGLPPGPYQVVAYVDFGAGLAGGYSQAVPCGLSVNCNDHSLITVNVTAGGTVTGADPIDFYAPPGTFPPNPAP